MQGLFFFRIIKLYLGGRKMNDELKTLIVGIILGFLIGITIAVVSFTKKTVGTLREDRSTGEPYLFLEMDRDGAEKIHKYKTVIFKVKLEDYVQK